MISCKVQTPLARMLSIVTLLAPLSLAAPRAVVQAEPSGLNVVPTADIYDPGVPSVEYQVEGEGRLFARDCSNLVLVQLGVARGLDVGVDKCVDSSGEAYLFNAKYRLREGEGSRPALAAGIQNLGRGQVAQPYLVGGWGFDRPLRAHAGTIALEGALKPMLGADYTWKSLTLQADWVGGRENAASVGLTWAPHPSMTTTYAIFIPNRGGGSRGHMLNVQYLMKLW